MRALTRLGLIDAGRESELARGWRERIGIRTPDMGDNILSLSGGNQQKALFARALGSDAEIVLMDDPMRGVDVGTKREVYAMIRDEAARGRTFLWYTTETRRAAALRPRLRVPRGAGSSPTCPGPTAPRRRCCTPRSRAGVSAAILSRRTLRDALPALSLAVLLAAIFWLQPRTMSYFGLNLLLNLAIPIALATIAQMFVITVNDLDLGIGAYRRLRRLHRRHLAGRDAAAWRRGAARRHPGLRRDGCADPAARPALDRGHARHVVRLAGPVGADPADSGRQGAGMGALADDPEAAASCRSRSSPRSVIAIVAHVLLMRSSYGAVLRGAGGNPRGGRAGRLVAAARQGGRCSRLAGFFGVLSGLALIGLTTSADANIALRYTLLSIAGVILGGGEFVGGRVSPVGAVIGAMTLTLAGSFLSFLRIPPDWQIGAQGAILIIVLALRVLINRTEARGRDAASRLAKPWLWSWLAAVDWSGLPSSRSPAARGPARC